MKLILIVDVPTSADPDEVLSHLLIGANRRQGITITLPQGNKADVDLLRVREVLS